MSQETALRESAQTVADGPWPTYEGEAIVSDWAMDALRAALAALPKPDTTLDRLAAGIRASLTIRLISGDTAQTYTPNEVAVMVSEVIDQQLSRLAAESDTPERPA